MCSERCSGSHKVAIKTLFLTRCLLCTAQLSVQQHLLLDPRLQRFRSSSWSQICDFSRTFQEKPWGALNTSAGASLRVSQNFVFLLGPKGGGAKWFCSCFSDTVSWPTSGGAAAADGLDTNYLAALATQDVKLIRYRVCVHTTRSAITRHNQAKRGKRALPQLPQRGNH